VFFQPGKYLAHLIGHEGPGSLLSDLKAHGWVNALVAGRDDGARGFDFFMIQVDLTEAGLSEGLRNSCLLLFVRIAVSSS